MLTLTYGSTTQSLADWGLTDPIQRWASQEAQSWSVRVPKVGSDLAYAPPIPYGGAVVIMDGETVLFRGKQTTDRRVFSPLGPGYELVFKDALWDLERLVFQQSWKYKVGGDPVAATTFSRLNLFQDYTGGGLLVTGNQVRAVVDWAAACGVSLQSGTIDDLPWQPIYPVKAMMCSEVLKLCLRPVPDAQLWVDPSTNPPSLCCRQRANLVAVSLPWKDGTTHESGEIVRRQDLEVPAVWIQYQKSNDVNGKIYTQFGSDLAPVGGNALQPGALIVPIDLTGGKRVDLSVEVESEALNPSDLDWWRLKKPDLADDKYVGLALVGTPTIVDDDGEGVSLGDLPNELLNGEVLAWMVNSEGFAVVSKQVTVTGEFSYVEVNEYGATTHVVSDANPQRISVRLKLTNADPGLVTYSTLEHNDPGEPQPTGLAAYLYAALQSQFEGSHVIRQAGANGAPVVPVVYGPWNRLHLTGGAAEWVSMGAAIQSSVIDWTHGQQTIVFGPPVHLSPDQLWSWLQHWTYRSVFDAPNLRTSGEITGTTAQLGGKTKAENTSHGNPAPAVHTVAAATTLGSGAAGTTRVKADMQAGTWSLEKVLNDAAATTAPNGRVRLTLSALPDGVVLEFRQVCVRVNGQDKAAWTIMSEPA